MSQPKPIKEQLIDLFNAALLQSGIETVYVEADLVFGEPVPYEEGTVDTSEIDSHNTTILVTAGTGLEEVVYNLHYTRLNLDTLSGMFAAEVETDITVESSTHDVLDLVSTHLGFELTIDDLEDDLFENIDADSNRIVLRAKATSLAVFGASELIVNDSIVA